MTDALPQTDLPAASSVQEEKAVARRKEKLQNIRSADRSDWIFVGSFLGAAGLGIANAINSIRHGFYESFVKPAPTIVMGYRRDVDLHTKIMTETSIEQMVEIAKDGVKMTNAERHPFGDLFQQRQQVYEALSERYHRSGKTLGDGVKYQRDKIAASRHVGGLINDRVKAFGIETRGWRGWTTDVWKQRAHTGDHTRRGAVFAGAQVAVVTLGAIATLKYSKHLLDLLGKQAEENQARER